MERRRERDRRETAAPTDPEALRRSEARYRALVEAGATDVWLTTPDGRLTTDLPRWRTVSGQRIEELLGDGWIDAVHPDDRERAAQVWRSAVAQGAHYAVDYRIVPVGRAFADDEARWLEVRGVPVHDDDGTVIEYVGVTVDVTERRRAEQVRERLSAIATAAADRTSRILRVTAALSPALRVVDIATTVLAEARLALGTSAGGVSLLDETGTRLRYQALEGYDTDVKAQWADVSLRTAAPGPEVLRTGEPLLVCSAEELLERFPTPEIARFVAVSQEHAWARLPLATTGRPFGVLALGFAEARAFDDDERAFLLALAGVAAQALERAVRYERQRDTALLLQRSLLPERLPDLPGLQLSGTYRPGTTGVEVGGDWYDAFPVAGGRVALVVGDVRGKGAPAATVMGQVRAALRAYAVLDPDPAAVLSRLDLFMGAAADVEEIATVAYAVLDPATGALEHASAGHLPAVVRSTDGTAHELDGGGGLPLGVDVLPRRTARTVLPPGGTLVLVSDGLVERRDRSLTVGLAALCDAVAAAGPDRAEAVAERLLEVLVDGPPEDDVTVLVVRRDPGRQQAREVSLALPDDLHSAARARALVRTTLTAWGLDVLHDAASLVVSELVTNAVVHARSGPLLVLSVRGDVLRISVRDDDGGTPPRPLAVDDDASHGRGLALVDAVGRRWGVEQLPDGGKSVWCELAEDP